MPLNNKTDTSRGFLFVSAPVRISNELSRLNIIDFNGKHLVTEYAEMERKQ